MAAPNRTQEQPMHRLAIASIIALAALAAGRAEDKGTVTEIDGLKSTTPATWKYAKPATNMQVASFTIPPAEGDKYDATLTVYFFGAGGGGGAKANIDRWKTMIKPAEGTKAEDAYKTSSMKAGDVKITVFEGNGIYRHKDKPFDPKEEAELRPNYRLVGVIFESPNGPYFMRMVGPAKTMEANKKAFEDWLKNFK
jgi:hypothetical protein